MSKRQISVRQARKEDAAEMLRVYNDFARQFVGSASRTLRTIKVMLRKRDYGTWESVNWVALDDQDRLIGYVHAHLDRRGKRGEFREIVVHPKHDFENVARALVEEVNAVFMGHKVAAVLAGSVRNPGYEKLFPKMGFFESESTGVFMYAILDVKKFLSEVSRVFVDRLSRVKSWSGLVQIECEGNSIFITKNGQDVQTIIWTNRSANLKVTLNPQLLTKLLFGTADAVESHRAGQLKTDTTESRETVEKLLCALFPQEQFLIMDYW